MITLREQVQCVELEIERRKRAYPAMVQAGKMNKFKCENEIKKMEAVRNSLLLLPMDVALVKTQN